MGSVTYFAVESIGCLLTMCCCSLTDDTGNFHYLTKGDNNLDDDTILYPPGQKYVGRGDIMGVVRGYSPLVGHLTLLSGEYPWVWGVGLGSFLLISMYT